MISRENVCQLDKDGHMLPQINTSDNTFMDRSARFDDIPQVITLEDSTDDIDNQSSICSVSCHDTNRSRKPSSSSKFDHHMRVMCILPQGRPLACPRPLPFQQKMLSRGIPKNNKRKLMSPSYHSPLKYISPTFIEEDRQSVSSKRCVSDCSSHTSSTMLKSMGSSSGYNPVPVSSLVMLNATNDVELSTSKEFRNMNLLTLVASHVYDNHL